MRIGIFTDIYKPAINGVTTSIETFREELTRKGHEVFIFAPRVEDLPEEKNVIRIFSIDELSSREWPIAVPIGPIISKTIKPLKLDIVHTQLPFLVGYLGHRVAEKLNLPEVHTYHTHLTEYAHYIPLPFLQPIIRYGLKRLSRSFCNQSDLVIAPSSSIRDLLLSADIKERTQMEMLGMKQEYKEELILKI